eukprot:gene25389-37854_t
MLFLPFLRVVPAVPPRCSCRPSSLFLLLLGRGDAAVCRRALHALMNLTMFNHRNAAELISPAHLRRRRAPPTTLSHHHDDDDADVHAAELIAADGVALTTAALAAHQGARTRPAIPRNGKDAPNITIELRDLFHQLDPRLPRGYYRIPGLVATTNGTLLAFVMGRMHRTDATPNIVYLRRSFDGGREWTEAAAYGGAPVVDPATGAVHF